MLRRKIIVFSTLAAILGPCLVSAHAASKEIRIGVLVSSTGPAAVVGLPQQNTVGLMPRQLDGVSIVYDVLDDGGNPTATVKNARKLIEQDHVDVILGPSLSPNAVAVMGIAADAKTPMIAACGTDAVILPMNATRRWIFKTAQTDEIILEPEISNMQQHHVRRLGLLRLNDSLGQEWAYALKPLAAKAGLQLVADEQYERVSNSIDAQAIKVIEAKPDAVLIAAVGGSAAMAQSTLRKLGYRGLIYQTDGAATPDFIRLTGSSAAETLMAASPLQVVHQLPDSNPFKATGLAYVDAYKKMYGKSPATFGANIYDGWLLLQRALPSVLAKDRPGTPAFRAALRNALESTKGLIGTQGEFNMTPSNHNGMDARSALMMTVKDGRWKLLQ